MKKVAILQSNYIPWKGYFDLINSVDEFIIYDDMQYTRRDWRNRNRIITSNGLKWLTIPVQVKGNFLQKINETRVSDSEWPKIHWRTILHNYRKTPFFDKYADYFEDIYLNLSEEMLSRINYIFIKAINDILGIRTKILWSSDFDLIEGKSERLLDLCKQSGADKYISGPSARTYLDVELFENEGICVEWADYTNYPEYEQRHKPFEHGVTILDLLFNQGEKASLFMKSCVMR